MNRRQLIATLIAGATGARPALSIDCDTAPPIKMTALFRDELSQRPGFFGSITVEVSKLQAAPYGVSCLGSLVLAAWPAQKISGISVVVHPPSGKDEYFDMEACPKAKSWHQGTYMFVVPKDLPESINKLFVPGTSVSIKAAAGSGTPRVFFLKAPCGSTPRKA